MTEQELTKEMIDVATKYVDKVVDAPLKEIGGIFADNISYWRFKNKINIFLKTKKFLESKNIQPKKLLPDIFIPLIEEAGNISDEKLADMFSNLLSNHLNPEKQNKVHPSYSKILSQLAPLDATILNILYGQLKKQNKDYRKNCIGVKDVSDAFSINEENVILSFQNIMRLGICDYGDNLNSLNKPKYIAYTEFGWSFIEACNV